jgi:phospholipase/carboxylesterase
MALPVFEIDAQETQRGTVIWMHGLGASNHDFEPIVPELNARFLRFVFPAAPLRPVTINQGYRMPAWYDILSLSDPPLREKEADVRESTLAITELIEQEESRGVQRDRIVLAGFSQGGAMALHVGLRSPRLAGVLCLSGYLVLPDRLLAERHADSAETPFLFCHGRQDSMVPLAGGKKSYERVLAAGCPAEWREYDMDHSLCLEEVWAIREWLAARF